MIQSTRSGGAAPRRADGRPGAALPAGPESGLSHPQTVLATPKHFAVHSGPEESRHRHVAPRPELSVRLDPYPPAQVVEDEKFVNRLQEQRLRGSRVPLLRRQPGLVRRRAELVRLQDLLDLLGELVDLDQALGVLSRTPGTLCHCPDSTS